MKDYLNFEVLTHFFNRLKDRFSPIGHKHSKEDIDGVQDFVVTDDGEGNVFMTVPTFETLVTSENDVLTVGDETK